MSRSIDRVATILKALARAPDAIGVNELARAVDLAPATVHRALTALCAEGLAEQDPASGKYDVGPAVVPIAMAYLGRHDLGNECLPVMRTLADEVGESVNLGVLGQNSVYYIHQVDGPNPLRFAFDVGRSVPLYCSALGKLLLAYTPDASRSDALAQLDLQPHTELTITSMSALRSELSKIRSNGYSIDRGENIKDLIGIAAPVRDWNGGVIAGLSVMGPSMRLTAARIQTVTPVIVAAANALSRRLGGRIAN